MGKDTKKKRETFILHHFFRKMLYAKSQHPLPPPARPWPLRSAPSRLAAHRLKGRKTCGIRPRLLPTKLHNYFGFRKEKGEKNGAILTPHGLSVIGGNKRQKVKI